MGKKITIIILLILVPVLFGTTAVGNFFSGDINMIDEGQFAAWGNHMLFGKYMYKDIYIVYGPLLVYPVYILYKIFTPSAFIIRLYLSFGASIGIVGAYYLMGQLKINKLIKFIFLVILILIPAITLREAVALWTLYFLMISHSNKSKILTLISGILTSLTLLVSQDFGIFIGVVSCVHYLFQFIISRDVKLVLTRFMYFVFGLISIWIGFFIWSSSEGWFWDYVRVTKDVSISLSGINVPNGQNFPNPSLLLESKNLFEFIKNFFSKEMLLYISLLLYFASMFYLFTIFFLKRLTNERYNFLMLVIFGILLYSILLTRSGIGHFYYVLPPIILICGYFLNLLVINYKKTPNLSLFFTILISVYVLRLLYLNNPNIIKAFTFATYINLNYENPSRVGLLNISDLQKRKIANLQSFIWKNTTKEDYVFFFTDAPAMYMLVDRLNPTNYDLPFAGNTIGKRYHMLNAIILKKPKYIFIDKSAWAVDGISNSQRLPELFSYIKKSYFLIEEIDKTEIYILKNLLR